MYKLPPGNFHLPGVFGIDSLGAIRNRLHKIYLAGPLTNLSQRQGDFTLRVRNIVMTEFSRCGYCDFYIYDPADNTSPGSGHSPIQVCAINRLEVCSSDLLCLCRTGPSDGAGMEQAWAASCQIPILIVHPSKASVSRMTLSTSGADMPPISFTGLRQFRNELRIRMPGICRYLFEKSLHRGRSLEDGWARKYRKLVVRGRLISQLTRMQLAVRCGVNAEFLRLFEEHDEIVLSASNGEQMPILNELGLHVTRRLASGAATLESNGPEPPESLPESLRIVWSDSLDSLADFVVDDQPPRDRDVIKMWSDYSEMMVQGVVGREDYSGPITTARWRAQYREHRNPGLYG
ncbi:MAG: hypothetical protein JWN70_4457 [Planctomycetaceae bacterium]|nr:hypothetical protein [Planctomycetaceae bacterium]